MATNDHWLALVQEDTIEPELPICDPHHHLWDHRYERVEPRYLLDELLADINSGHNVVATVFVQCTAMHRAEGPEAMRPVGENGIRQRHCRHERFRGLRFLPGRRRDRGHRRPPARRRRDAGVGSSHSGWGRAFSRYSPQRRVGRSGYPYRQPAHAAGAFVSRPRLPFRIRPSEATQHDL